MLSEIGAYSENEEERAIVKAQLELPLSYFDFANQKHKQAVIAIFLEWAHMIGVKEANTPEENIMNAKFLIANFDYMTITEIRQAIQWSIVGKLDIDPNPYGKLAPIYMAKILNKYLEKRDWVVKNLHLRLAREKANKELEAKHYKPYSQIVADHKNFLIKIMLDMKQHGKPDAAGGLVWRFMTRAKKVNEGMFDQACYDYADEKMKLLKVQKAYREEISKLTANQIEVKAEHTHAKFMQQYVLFKVLNQISDIPKFVVSQPDEIISPKQKINQ